MDLEFDCPRCQSPLSADPSEAGTQAICTHCRKPIAVPFPPPALPQPTPVFTRISPPTASAKTMGDASAALAGGLVWGALKWAGKVAINVGQRAARDATQAAVGWLAPKTVAFRRNHVVLGEYPFEVACRMVESGEIRPTDEYLHEGMEDYRPVSESEIARRLGLR